MGARRATSRQFVFAAAAGCLALGAGSRTDGKVDGRSHQYFAGGRESLRTGQKLGNDGGHQKGEREHGCC